ncbi:hypothetical protein Z517_07209 [Fonsecaea pedrosoi CBS 271.37]|uniref:Uncharacterized protein n=1 Tax=Fonsecaea pedrosoi CBS 271.37 TaxID=1442368 RepID=A0A0D2GIH7_9EURO|nr:uncharacterized protein Z517_07209 [Fonsecaea pedrosoi CBS 271.37]KIW80593.1 hypothetical protein Z517_07209 [Fonsecaea pedrosoi CBS 271.37]
MSGALSINTTPSFILWRMPTTVFKGLYHLTPRNIVAQLKPMYERNEESAHSGRILYPMVPFDEA